MPPFRHDFVNAFFRVKKKKQTGQCIQSFKGQQFAAAVPAAEKWQPENPRPDSAGRAMDSALVRRGQRV
jgi:hypothetical protein